MKLRRLLALAAAASVLVALAGCATAPAVEPVVVKANDLQGETVTVPLNSMLVIQTGDLKVDSYTGEVEDPSIAEFVKGARAGDFDTYPGMKPKKVGETKVTLKNENGGIQDLEFTIKVTPVPAGSNLGGSGR